MTVPRRIVEGATYLLTRRCFSRMFLLRPSALTNAVFEYALGLAAQRYGIRLHAYCVLSNHWHCVLTDPNGKLPKFAQDLASIVARALNASFAREESFWAPGSYSAVELQEPADVVDKMAYGLANPVAAGLVRRGSMWPGLWSPPTRIGSGPRTVMRPDHFFRPEGEMPDSVGLELHCPPGFESSDEARKRVMDALERKEDEAARAMAAEGRAFLGARKAMAQRPFARPTTMALYRGLNPRVASRDKWKRIEAIGRLKTFLADYREAWRAFTDGRRGTTFPNGTYWMRVAFGVRCVATR